MHEQNYWRFGPFRLDVRNEQLWRGHEVLRLTNKALAVLCYLLEHSGQLVTKDELFAAVWPGVVVGDSALVVCIRELRQALGDERRTPQFIETVHGRGYRFIAEVVRSQAEEVSSEQLGVSSGHEAGSNLNEAQRNPGEEENLSRTPLRSSQATELHLNPQPLDASLLPAQRSWSVRSLMVMSLVLLVGVILTVQYLSRPTLSTQSSVLVTAETKPPLPLPDKPSIIILPFVNLSNDPQQEYFSDGITADITSKLAQLSQLFVISRTSAFSYKGKPTKVQDISKEMGVQYALEGSVRKTEDQLRITVELIDATSDHQLWAEQYDRPLKNLFVVQDEIVHRIVTTLNLQLTVREQGVIVRRHTNNLEAYDVFLRGTELHMRFTKETTAQARQMFEKVLTLDPQYAEAYVMLAFTYHNDWILRWSTDPQTLERALALVQQAVAIDDSLPDAHSLLGMIYTLKQQYDQAIAEGEQAIALAPNDGDSYGMQAQTLIFVGRAEEALKLAKRAMRLNPRYPVWYPFELGWAYRLTGQSDEAITALKEALRQNPNYLPAHLQLALSYLTQWALQQNTDDQTLDQAATMAHRGLTLSDSLPRGHWVLGQIYLWQKQYDLAIAELERGIALDPNDAGGYALLAEILSRVGRSEEAARMVEQALRRKTAPVNQHLFSIGIAYYLTGRPEEAIALLKQYLVHYPNFLAAHLCLAAAYNELGQEGEARAEAAEVLKLNPKFSLAVLKNRAPIKDSVMLERYIAALRKAGLK